MGCRVCGGVPTGGVDKPHECPNGHEFAVHATGSLWSEPPTHCPFCGAALVLDAEPGGVRE